jgi:hypothetical protein
VDVRRLLRTDLDNELAKITYNDSSARKIAHLSDMSSFHSKQRSNVRRRSLDWNEDKTAVSSVTSKEAPVYAEDVWNNLVQHAWQTANSIHRTSIGSLIHSNEAEQDSIPCPFLVCTMEIKGQQRHSSSTNDYEDILTSFNKGYEQSILIKSAHNETCGVLTLTTSDASQGISSYNGRHDIIAMPLVDIIKIQQNTIDETSSLGWSVPYVNNSKADPSPSLSNNVTERLGQWERLIIVDFAPGLGGMREESELLTVVNEIMSDIQDMGEMGWLHRLNEQERQSYEVDESVALVPTLSDMFSLTATLNNSSSVGKDIHSNTRIAFWNEAFERGIESEHACSEMFSTLFVKPRSGYYSFDLILNPADGPPPSDYESSASNPACVSSLIAGLSVHRKYCCIVCCHNIIRNATANALFCALQHMFFL